MITSAIVLFTEFAAIESEDRNTITESYFGSERPNFNDVTIRKNINIFYTTNAEAYRRF